MGTSLNCAKGSWSGSIAADTRIAWLRRFKASEIASQPVIFAEKGKLLASCISCSKSNK